MSEPETSRAEIFVAVLAERKRQDSLWGEQNHPPLIYLGILAEEFGEAAKAAVDLQFNCVSQGAIAEFRAKLLVELIQTAAVAIAFAECLDRGKWKVGS